MQLDAAVDAVVARVSALPAHEDRHLIAIAGPPASGKSTLAQKVVRALPDACVVPMDGFHLDNRLLDQRNLRARKGAPETFDVNGFQHLLSRLRTDTEVIYPLFDRTRDCAIAGAGCVDAKTRTIVIEGNYLLLDAPGWRNLQAYWDLTAYLSVPNAVLRARLLQRWHDHGYAREDAERKVDENDMPNALTTQNHLLTPDFLVEETT
ncbi:MAG: nucleoside/nucleotide kinase family protein [Roseobacter sp.]